MSIFRNQGHFSIPTMKYQKEKLGKIPFTIATRKLKYVGINLTKEVKLSLSADDMIVSWTPQKKLLNLISEFAKIAGYKVNIQKLKAFLYNTNKISETEIRKNPIYYSNNKNKIPRNKLNQGGKRHIYTQKTTEH